MFLRILLAATTLTLFSGCASPYGKTPVVEPGRRLETPELLARLNSAAWGEVWNQELVLDQAAQAELDSMVRSTAQNLIDRGTQSRDAPLGEARLREFVRSVAELTRHARSDAVDASLLDTVRRKICPVYPICGPPK